jgi:hypothetical protein
METMLLRLSNVARLSNTAALIDGAVPQGICRAAQRH